jgi:hypothetical protein
MQDEFINYINNLNIRVTIVTIERIYNSYFPGNELFKKNANKFKYLKHISSDAEDSVILNSPIAKQLFSKEFDNIRDTFNKNFKDKKNKIIFIGQLDTISNSHWYASRKQILQNLVSYNKYEIDFYQSDSTRSFYDYLSLLSQYKFIINPLGVGSFLSMRYYETLFTNSVPIQQYNQFMIDKYQEINNTNGLFFKNNEELYAIIDNLKEKEEYYCYNLLNMEYLEDYINSNKIFEDLYE